MAVKGVIFDLDGVLVLSSAIHATAFRTVLRKVGIPGIDYPRFAGMRTIDVFRILLVEHGIDIPPQRVLELASEKTSIALDLLGRENPIAHGAVETLRVLARDRKLALATSASKATVDSFLDRNGIRDVFSSVLTGHDVDKAKPDPEIYARSAERLGLEPAECVVVEDAFAGVEAARAAGMAVWGIATTESSERLRQAGAGPILTSIEDIPRILEWTALIPAAGRGSRLGYNKPKILYPVAGRTILEWLIVALGDFCSRFVFVLSPEGRDEVEMELRRLLPRRYSVATQPEPLGMAHAIECGVGALETASTLIVWGDQVALKPESIGECMRRFEESGAEASVPTVQRRNPYIHFERDAEGRIAKVRQAREGDMMPAEGESDAGVFLFRTGALKQRLATMRGLARSTGAKTGEWNFLPIFEHMVAERERVTSPDVLSLEETIGINSEADAAAIGPVLAERARRR